MTQPNENITLPQLERTPQRHFYTGSDMSRALSIGDLRARAHKLMPRFVLEYLEGGAEDEASLARERQCYAEWRFIPRQLVDVSRRSLETEILGKPAAMPLAIAPTGLNALFMHQADSALAQAAVGTGVPYIQSTMSNDTMEEVAIAAPGVRHWWQLYVLGGDEIWQELLRRADACGCEALVLTTNSQIFGDREWSSRDRIGGGWPDASSMMDAASHPRWFAGSMAHGMPTFANVIDFVPEGKRGFFESANWIRSQMPKSLSWNHVAKIRDRWKKPFLLKGLLHPDDIRKAIDSGVDGVILGTHGGRQEDWSVAALDVLPEAAEIVRGRIALMMSGGIRRGTDMLKAMALGADAVIAGRAPLYGLCAAGAEGAARALEILHDEATNDMGQMGVARLSDLTPEMMVSISRVAYPGGRRGSAMG
ncbi:alpha-hydroxy acid oxidase [Hephaestia mangrovi]|uniref:alpha-hydroxy acid oxidase n=1 Tax=Hephaestia mangrovi TaxID=2873268 RepID=UPI001CA759F4|nr:alpha-hydroxy acid oxidase [Hephaestia mangrovi]MBY8829680.1 alpha-hydroxy-acid oxidizing protein [Hephaestia mangrovi]